MKNLAIIPARSGSKGIKNKNIRLLDGKPLMAYSIEAAMNAKIFDCVHVSTDSTEYADIARRYGASVDFLRSNALSGDSVSSMDVIKFVIAEYVKRQLEFETVMLLQPTSPLRTADNILEAYEIFQNNNAESVISVCECEYLPLLSNTLPENYSMFQFLDTDFAYMRRQEVGKYYRINGAIYLMNTKLLQDSRSIYGPKSYAYIMKKEQSVDIDDEYDLKLAEFFMSERNKVKR